MKIKNKVTIRVICPQRTSDKFSPEELKRLTDLFLILYEIDCENKAKEEIENRLT